jgi:hypothetical protein
MVLYLYSCVWDVQPYTAITSGGVKVQFRILIFLTELLQN